MTSILTFLEQRNGKILKASACAARASAELKRIWGYNDEIAVVLGVGAKEAASDALSFGFSKIYFLESQATKHYVASVYSTLVKQICSVESVSAVVAAATAIGKDLAPRIAVFLEGGQATDIVAVNSDGTLRRPMYAGDLLADVEILTDKRVVTVRASAFTPRESGSVNGVTIEMADVAEDSRTTFVSFEGGKLERPELSEAQVVVSGGRGLQSKENFEKVLFPLADAMGGAVGASRQAVDSGFAPNDWQVGQTGKIVAPELYLAIGISGAIQHLAGMKNSKVIVAINKNPEAPIFEVADYGLVADLFVAVPELTAKLAGK